MSTSEDTSPRRKRKRIGSGSEVRTRSNYTPKQPKSSPSGEFLDCGHSNRFWASLARTFGRVNTSPKEKDK